MPFKMIDEEHMSQEDADDLDNDESNSRSELFEQRISTAEQHDRRDNLKK